MVVAELVGATGGVGYQLLRQQQLFDMAGAMAWTLQLVLFVLVVQQTITAIENWAFGLKMAEYHSGYMLYSGRTIAAIPFEHLSDSFDFDLEMIVMAHIRKLRICEIGIPTIYADEESHLKPIQYGLRVLRIVRDYRRGKYAAISESHGADPKRTV